MGFARLLLKVEFDFESNLKDGAQGGREIGVNQAECWFVACEPSLYLVVGFCFKRLFCWWEEQDLGDPNSRLFIVGLHGSLV